jgi:predicted subunit of tRNA(5-methylaminomethyl-2-thiouridylate) methyltransferase
LVVEDRADQVTVQYTCRGRGYGRTTIRRETGRLVQIQTQGIAEGLPFDFAAEARRMGDCGN